MTRQTCMLILAVVVLLGFVTPAGAVQVPFTMRLQQGQVIRDVADGSGITLAADAIGMPATATVTITYTAAGPQSIGSATFTGMELTGITNVQDFSVSGLPAFPFTLSVNQSVTLTLRYTPTTSNRINAYLALTYQENMGSAITFGFNLTGLAPEFAFSYILQPSGNASLVAPGGTIALAPTSTSGTSSAVVVLSNKGSGPGAINNVAATGDAFQLSGVPLAGTLVNGGSELRFTLAFSPKQVEPSRGTLTINFADRAVTFNLQGSGVGPAFAYEIVRDGAAVPVMPNQGVAMPDTALGSQSSLVLRVRNTGNADGTVQSISILGDGFQLSGLPFLPAVLPAGGATTFTITFAPSLAGANTGRLKIGNDYFDVTGAGLGATLAYSYTVGDTTFNLRNNPQVNFTPVSVGRNSSVRFTIANTGSAAATITSITLSGAGQVFTMPDLPALPLKIAPGGDAAFTLQFTPAALGAASATLNVDAQAFALAGSGSNPDPLPAYSFDAPAGPVDAMQQPAIGLTLANPYPLALTGTLTINFNSDVFTADPAVQFATGGKTVAFTIPANSTKAVFPNNSNQIRIQTGTVAGSIAIVPSFTAPGGIDITPQSPAPLNLVVPQSAPKLLGVEVSQKTSNSFNLLVKGYATARSLTQMDFQFTPYGGENVSANKVTMNVEPSFIAWFQSQNSQQYGSLFTATVPFTVQGDLKNVSSPVDAIQSVSVTITNRQGTSQAQSVSLR